MIALLEQLMRVLFVENAPNCSLQVFYRIPVWFVYERQTCKMSVFWKVADLPSLHLIFFYKVIITLATP